MERGIPNLVRGVVIEPILFGSDLVAAGYIVTLDPELVYGSSD